MAIRPGKKKNYSRILKTRLQPNSKKQKGYSRVFKTWLQAELSYSHVLKRGSWYSVVFGSFYTKYPCYEYKKVKNLLLNRFICSNWVYINYFMVGLCNNPPYLCRYCPFWGPYSSQFCFSSQSTQQWVKNDSSP